MNACGLEKKILRVQPYDIEAMKKTTALRIAKNCVLHFSSKVCFTFTFKVGRIVSYLDRIAFHTGTSPKRANQVRTKESKNKEE